MNTTIIITEDPDTIEELPKYPETAGQPVIHGVPCHVMDCMRQWALERGLTINEP